MNGTSGLEMKNNEDAVYIPNAPETISPSKPMSSDPPEEDLTTRALRFLSTASLETIGGIAVGLAASTYLILGRLGLVLIGAVGGIVLHAAWERQSQDVGSSEDIRREKGLDVIKRILDLRQVEKAGEEDEDEDDKVVGNSFEGFQPETAAALNELVDAVIRDYVKWWYHPILPIEQSFPSASRSTLTRFILAISQHLSRKRHADTFLDFLANSSSIVIVFLDELSSAISASQGNVPPAEAVDAYLSANPDSNLANVLNEKQQSRKFKMVAEDILQNFLEKPTYDCDPARMFLREILGGLILQMSLTSCSKPEWINGWIVYLLEDGEPDFSQAIDAGMGGGGSTDDSLSGPFHDFDGNMGNIGLAKPLKPAERQKQEMKGHKKRLSKAEEAMEEAMEEAQRLSRLIADEDAKKIQSQPKPVEDAPEALVAAVEQNVQSLHLDTSPLTSNGSIGPSVSGQNVSNGIPKPLQTTGLSSKAAEPTNPIWRESTAKTQSQDFLSSPESSTSPTSHHTPAFTNFDQIIPQALPLALQDGSPTRRRKTVSLTLHNANVIIHDDSTSADKGRLRSKPNADYLVQIEPASSDHPGWMIVRRYPDFETLHEVLRRIALVSGVKAFTEQHQSLPNWKEHTKPSLRGELERYLRDALWYKALAESEGMKRFLEKDHGQTASTSKNGFPGIGWPTPSAFESMGKGMLDVLTSAPKGVAEGGKAIGGGITGVFNNIGNLGQKKVVNGTHVAGRSSTSTLPRMDSMNSIVASSRSGRASEDSMRAMPIVSTQPSILPTMTRRPSHNSIAEGENEQEPRVSTSARSSMSGRRSVPQSRDASRAPSSRRGTPLSSPTQGIMGDMKLPPPPGEMPDDYGSHPDDSSTNSRAESNVPTTARTSISTAPSQPSPGRPSLSGTRRSSVQVAAPPAQKPRARKEQTPLTEAETKVAVELMFAVINELYTLSSAWNIRRTLLNAAKTFLLRPSNPSLAAIQSLIQGSVIASNTSDAGVAAHILKIRANTLPTEEELKEWPAEMSTKEKEKLRVKARKLLVERGVPAALTGVMGQAATGEAMGRIFDCLQVEEVAKGLMFGLLLQGVRAVTQ